MRIGWLWLLVSLGFALPLSAEESALRELLTGDDSKGWEAVGRLNLGDTGFCTGALIATDLVLTAAHCLFDQDTGNRIAAKDMEFLAGWRNGRAVAYRQVKQALEHPAYSFEARDRIDRVAYDLALLKLEHPIRLTSITPFETDIRPRKGDEVEVVSYAQDRAEAPSLQEVCYVLGSRTGVLVLSCSVDFGSSGAPVFIVRDGVARIVSVVSAKAELDLKKVALGIDLAEPLIALRAALAAQDDAGFKPWLGQQGARDGMGAKFVRP